METVDSERLRLYPYSKPYSNDQFHDATNEMKLQVENTNNISPKIDRRHLPATKKRKQLISKKLKKWHKLHPATELQKIQRSHNRKEYYNSLSEEDKQKVKDHLYSIRSPHPALGKRWTLSEEQRLVSYGKRKGSHHTQEIRDLLSKNASERIRAGDRFYKSGRPSTVGKRKDLGIFLRSKWEANYARYLNFLVKNKKIRSWTYEPETFWFEKIKRGTRSYTPDFFVTNNNGTTEYHEVKGWMDPKSKTKLDRMQRYYPKVKVIIIDGEFMKGVKNSVAGLIENWEY